MKPGHRIEDENYPSGSGLSKLVKTHARRSAGKKENDCQLN